MGVTDTKRRCGSFLLSHNYIQFVSLSFLLNSVLQFFRALALLFAVDLVGQCMFSVSLLHGSRNGYRLDSIGRKGQLKIHVRLGSSGHYSLMLSVSFLQGNRDDYKL